MAILKLVTRTQVQNALQIDTDAPDVLANLDDLIAAASQSIAAYIGPLEMDKFLDSAGDLYLDSAGDPIVDADVQRATTILVGIYFRDPDGAEMEKWQQGYLPFPVTALIYHRRVPTIG